MASDQRRSLLGQLRDYQSDFPEELTFCSRFISLISNYEHCFERSLRHAHITGSAWIVDESLHYAFMTHHARLNKWLQPGGHADGDENVARVALREAVEESGMDALRLFDSNIFDIDIHVIPAHGEVPEHEHFDIRYLIQADRSQPFRLSDESNELAWLPLDSLEEATGGNISIQRMVDKTRVIRAKMSSATY